MELEIDEMLVELIQNATQKALDKLFEEHKEKFYYCSLITTGEGLCPIISAWSYEALERVANEEEDVEEAKFYLKWSYDETPYFAYGEEYFEDVNKTEGEHTMKEFDPFVSKYLLDQGLQKTTAKMLEQFQDKLPTEFLDF